MAFRRTPLLGSHVLLLSHIRGVLPNWQCLGRSRPQPTWTRSYANAALRILNVCGRIGFPSLDVSETFSFVANALKVHMSECLLVDDTPLNVERAKAVGWRGVLFSGTAQLQRDLSDLFQPIPNRAP